MVTHKMWLCELKQLKNLTERTIYNKGCSCKFSNRKKINFFLNCDPEEDKRCAFPIHLQKTPPTLDLCVGFGYLSVTPCHTYVIRARYEKMFLTNGPTGCSHWRFRARVEPEDKIRSSGSLEAFFGHRCFSWTLSVFSLHLESGGGGRD